MAFIKTSNGSLNFHQQLLYLEDHIINKDVMLENLSMLSAILDKTGINWGPAFGTLIGIIRNDDILPWANVFNIYILKEDEERFKDSLHLLIDKGFKLRRYERSGIYFLERNWEFFKFFILRKISSDVRHTGGTDFIHEKYLQNTVKWNFNGIELNIPSELDDYLTFQYDDWIVPVSNSQKYSTVRKYRHWLTKWSQDHLPDAMYYKWLERHRRNSFENFKARCSYKGCPLPENIEFSNLRPRKYKKVLTVGVYDLIHKGHVELYRRAKGLGDYLIVAVQDSDYVLKYKPDTTLLNSTADRQYMVQSIRYVDEAVIYSDVSEIVKNVDFDVLVTGPDQCHQGFKKAIEWCERNGKEHVILGRTNGVSSSELKEKIATKKAGRK